MRLNSKGVLSQGDVIIFQQFISYMHELVSASALTLRVVL